jgi:hypothetical protein
MMMNYEREERQLSLIDERLDAYRRRELSLRRLVEDLDALWNELRDSSDSWMSRFREHWWTLEQVNAVALDRGWVDDLPADHRVLVDEAVDGLDFLTDEARAGRRSIGQ